MKSIYITTIAVCFAFCIGAFAQPTALEPGIFAECIDSRCERTGNVLSVPIGAEIEFRVEDSRGIETVKWKMGDGSEQSRTVFRHRFISPGKYDVLVTVYHPGESGGKATAGLTVHVIAAPPANGSAISWLERILTAIAGVLLGYFGR